MDLAYEAARISANSRSHPPKRFQLRTMWGATTLRTESPARPRCRVLASSVALSAGTRLGPYEILSPLGAGGMGEVYRARDTRLERMVAVKVLPQSLSADAAALARFEREAKAVAALSHPNILAIFDFGTHEGTAYAVTELLEGETLRQRLSEGSIPPRKAAEIAQAVGLGLAAAHDRGIVHRDLKPENLFLTKDGRTKILDFGLAREMLLPPSEDTHSPTVAQATEPGTVLGTVGYMSPEQVRGQPADHRSDIFSLGAVLYEMLSGNRAFRGETAVETMNAILKEDPPGLSQSGQHVSSGLERIVSHCLEKREGERFQSARDLAFDLGSLTTDGGAQLGGVTNPPRRRLARVLAATGGLAAMALLGTLVGRKTAPRPEPPRYERLTFRRGSILGARFTPDGQSVVYSAAWGEAPAELYVTRIGQPEARPLGIRNANLLSVSRGGEVAVLLSKKDLYGGEFITGMLARAAIEGGVPREVAGNINEADFSPDGSDFSVGRFRGARAVLEFPIGHLVAESPDVVSFGPRISPDGRSVAFAFYQRGRASIRTADRSGKTITLADGFVKIDHVCWHPSGREVWFNETDLKGRNGIDAVTLDGRVRTVATGVGLYLRDIAPDGRVLLSSLSTQMSILFSRTETGEKPRDLSWLDGSGWPSLSADGARMVFTEVGESEGLLGGSIYVRNTDGGPAVRLGRGFADDISPDGQWVLGRVHDSSGDHVSLIPVGAGSPKVVAAGAIRLLASGFFPNGRTILAPGVDTNGKVHVYALDPDGGVPRDVTGVTSGEGMGMTNSNCLPSPDGRDVACGGGGSMSLTIFHLGGSARELPEQSEGYIPIQWLSDGRSLLVWRPAEFPARIMLYDVVTGEQRLWKELAPPDLTGFKAITNVCVSRDGSAYAFSYLRALSQSLYLVEGMR
jgi:eukaryotic-like serine/threonine-protein kinase